jgi:hypothetical protein
VAPTPECPSSGRRPTNGRDVIRCAGLGEPLEMFSLDQHRALSRVLKKSSSFVATCSGCSSSCAQSSTPIGCAPKISRLRSPFVNRLSVHVGPRLSVLQQVGSEANRHGRESDRPAQQCVSGCASGRARFAGKRHQRRLGEFQLCAEGGSNNQWRRSPYARPEPFDRQAAALHGRSRSEEPQAPVSSSRRRKCVRS